MRQPVIPSGSSPPARGAQSEFGISGAQARIIPACAGSTARVWPRRRKSADHPRLRGEHDGVVLGGDDNPGSSPPARGAPEMSLRDELTRRIIPACAGSTRCAAGDPRRDGDHPRLRGEHGRAVVGQPVRHGSSPPARGAPRVPGPQRFGLRIIPACAGSTRCAGTPPPMRRDHPRLRGEHGRTD